MKKFVIILLTVLPIFLIVVIAFAGKIIQELAVIPVERVVFIDEEENEFDADHSIKLNKGDTYQLAIKIYPELSTNKKVSYVSNDIDVCTVDENGLVTAVGEKLATAIIVVKTDDGEKTAKLRIHVTDEKVSSVTLIDNNNESIEELTLAVGDSIQLFASVDPYTALNKKVLWSSSDATIVSVGQHDGKLVAKKQGTVTITVTTVDGGYIDTCEVTVGAGKAKLAFDFSENENIYPKNDVYITKLDKIRLIDYISYDEESVSLENVVITLDSGPATFDSVTGVLTITGTGLVKVTAKLNDGSGIQVSIILFLEQ